MHASTRHLASLLPRRSACRAPARLLSTGPLIREGIDAPDQPPPTPLSKEPSRPKPSRPIHPPTSIPHTSSPQPSRPSESHIMPPAPSEENLPSSSPEPTVVAAKYPYHITRTGSGNLPVYNSLIRKSRMITIVRRVEGKSHALRNDLLEHVFEPMGLSDFSVESRVKMPGHVEFRGHYRKEIVDWLTGRGF